MVDYGIANGDTSMCGRAAPFLANMCALIGDICAPFPRNSHLSTAKLAPFSLNCARTAEIRTRNFAVARAGLAPSRCRLQSPCAKSSRVRPHSARGLTPPTAAPGLALSERALRRCRRVQDGRRGPADHGRYLRADPRRDGARLRRRLPREDHAVVAIRTGGWLPVVLRVRCGVPCHFTAATESL